MDKLNIPTIFVDERWQQCLESYLRATYEHSFSMYTFRSYRCILTQFFADSRKPVEAYTRADVESYLHSLCHSPSNMLGAPAPATINFRLMVLKSFFHFASEYVVAGENGKQQHLFVDIVPTTGLHTSRRGEKEVYKAMSLSEIQRFFSAIDRSTVVGKRDYAVYLTFLYTTRRRAEVQRLRWGDLSVATFRDEGGQERTGHAYRFTQKGRAGMIETLQLPEPAYLAIEDYLVASGRMNSIRADDPLFIAHGLERNGYGGKRSAIPNAALHSDTIASNFKVYCKKAGLDTTKFSIHSWRHTGVQQRLSTGQSIVDTMRITGHKSLDTFYRYARRLSGQADSGADELERRFGNLGQKGYS